MLKILKGYYGSADITDKLNSMILNDTLITYASNDIFGDPNVGKVKRMVVQYVFNDKIYNKTIYEGYGLILPDVEPVLPNRTLLLTSCNRIKQVLLALTVNSYIIKSRFNLVIADASTPDVSVDDGYVMHSNEPYNHITEKNYCSDISLFDKHIPQLKNIDKFYFIHTKPRLTKTEGDANLITLGLAQAALLGDMGTKNNNYCLKLSGVSILNRDLLTELPTLLKNHDVLTFHRTGFDSGERSTRIFGCRPNVVSNIMINGGWYNWINCGSGDIEHRFADILNDNISDRINYTNMDESYLIDNGGCSDEDYRKRLITLINDNDIPKENELISEFLDGGVW